MDRMNEENRTPSNIPPDAKRYRLTSRKADAVGYLLEYDEILVLAGSRVSADITANLKKNVGACRERTRLEERGIIRDGVLTKDVVFSTLRTAATVICGTSTPGSMWKPEENIPQ